MNTYHVIDLHENLHVVKGQKFTMTDAGQLVISTDNTATALFNTGAWVAVKEIAGVEPA